MRLEKTITTIGKQAIASKEDDLLILFGESATPALRDVSVIQDWQKEDHVALGTGQKMIFGDQDYQIVYVGPLANDNLNSIGHVTLIFSEVPTENPLGNGIYLTPLKRPNIEVGMTITYE